MQISSRIRQSWMKLAVAEEEVETERKNMIDAIRKENMKKSYVEDVFTVSFEVI